MAKVGIQQPSDARLLQNVEGQDRARSLLSQVTRYKKRLSDAVNSDDGAAVSPYTADPAVSLLARFEFVL